MTEGEEPEAPRKVKRTLKTQKKVDSITGRKQTKNKSDINASQASFDRALLAVSAFVCLPLLESLLRKALFIIFISCRRRPHQEAFVIFFHAVFRFLSPHNRKQKEANQIAAKPLR